MSKFIANMETAQPLYVYLDFNQKFTLTKEQADYLNEEFERIIDENIKVGDVRDTCYIDSNYSFTDEPVEELEDFKLCIIVPITLECHVSYDPGLYTYANGDPGYPPSEEIEEDYGRVEEVDEENIFKEIKNLKYIGDNVKNVVIDIDEEPDFDADLEYPEPHNYYPD